MAKLFIKNRKEQKLSVIVELAQNPAGLAFVMHGNGGSKDEPHIQAFVEAFKAKDFNVVRFDTANSFGESEGNYEDATITNYYEDLEDVIGWAKTQAWYQAPFVLCGHSVGGMCVASYAEKFPNQVKALAPISSVVSSRFINDLYSAEEVASWQETGFRTRISVSKPGLIKKLKWAYYEDKLKHDLLDAANKLIMPVLLLVGDKDTTTLLKHQQALYDVLPGKKELHVIKGAEHTFRDEAHLNAIKTIIINWLETL